MRLLQSLCPCIQDKDLTQSHVEEAFETQPSAFSAPPATQENPSFPAKKNLDHLHLPNHHP